MAEHDAHSSFIKTPQQLVVVVLLAFIVPIVGIVLLIQLILNRPHADPAALNPEAVAARIAPVGKVHFGPAPAAEPSAAQPAGGQARAPKTGEEVVKTVCFACHGTGAAGAPKIGDPAAWGKLIGKGVDQMVKSAITGLRAMPPRGGNPDLSDLEVARAVVLMANQSGAKFKEPAATGPAAKK
ncbi:MAG TPA: c-type cytochrome [Burkholderiales bacterium]|nr:c-type cytochrome [Burkholderiales bacterium]